ncbi:hypothetical protein SDC9_192298 [bioreactor metagenome]|uniref:Uncharacterized protein n=1 Tax=bioreactor metagenome TaxID=1076179 RepID=A0A645IBD4_9ZZZZ
MIKRENRSIGHRNQRGPQRNRVGALLVRQTHHQWKAALSFADLSNFAGAHGFHHVQQGAGRDAVTGGGFGIDPDLQDRLPCELFSSDFSDTAYSAQDGLYLVGKEPELFKIISIDFDADIRADAGD